AIWRWLTLSREWGSALRALLNRPVTASPSATGTRRSCSSGPSHNAVRTPALALRHATAEMLNPRAAPAAAMTAGLPLSTNRAAGGNSCTALLGMSGGDWRAVDRSAIQPTPLRIIEDRGSHLDGNIPSRHRDVQSLPHSCAPAAHHCKRNGA